MQRMGVGAIIAVASICIAITALVSGLNSTSLSISCSGSVRANAPFTVTGVNGVYTGKNDITGQTTSGSDAAAVIPTVFGWMSSGQSVELIGNFTWASALTLSKSITMNCKQATITLAVNTNYPFTISSARVTILGGNWIGSIDGTWMLFQGVGSSYSVVDGADFRNFGIYESYGSLPTNLAIQNCTFHNRSAGGTVTQCIGLTGSNTVIKNCRFLHNAWIGIFIEYTSYNNQILNCEFTDESISHFMYISGANGGQGGGNIITGCWFHDQPGTSDVPGAIQIKCANNKIYGNTFERYGVSANGDPNVAVFSIYSQWTGTTANNNEIYNNTFTNISTVFWIGHGSDSVSPTVGNKIHDNTFTNVSTCVLLNPDSGAVAPVQATWVYYNDFINCAHPFDPSSAPSTLIKDTVIAYNNFSATVPNADVTALKSYVNTLIYGNTPWLADYPVPLPPNLPIPPP